MKLTLVSADFTTDSRSLAGGEYWKPASRATRVERSASARVAGGALAVELFRGNTFGHR
jgi:hypothetical protein